MSDMPMTDAAIAQDRGPRKTENLEALARRERIATAALQGLLSSWPSDTSLETEHTAIHAVEFADALIAELDK